MEGDGDVQELRGHREVLRRCVRHRVWAVPGVLFAGGSRAEQDQQGANSRHAWCQEVPRIKAWRRPFSAREVRQRPVEVPRDVRQVDPENVRVEQVAEATPTMSHSAQYPPVCFQAVALAEIIRAAPRRKNVTAIMPCWLMVMLFTPS